MLIVDILSYFDSNVENEEILWALCYQTTRSVQRTRVANLKQRINCRIAVEPETVYINADGSIDIVDKESRLMKEDVSYQNEAELLLLIGTLLCRCIDYSLTEKQIQQFNFGEGITELVAGLVVLNDQYVAEDNSLLESQWMQSWASSHFSTDGCPPIKFLHLDEVLQYCEKRSSLVSNAELESHYGSICADLVCEAAELRHFLDKTLLVNAIGVQHSTQEIKTLQNQWAAAWRKYVESYRNELSSRHCNENNNVAAFVYFGEILSDVLATKGQLEAQTSNDPVEFTLDNSCRIFHEILYKRSLETTQLSPKIKPIVKRAMLRQKSLKEDTNTADRQQQCDGRLTHDRDIQRLKIDFDEENPRNLTYSNDLIPSNKAHSLVLNVDTNLRLSEASKETQKRLLHPPSDIFQEDMSLQQDAESLEVVSNNESANCNCEMTPPESCEISPSEPETELPAAQNTFAAPKQEDGNISVEMIGLEDDPEDILYNKAGSSLLEICKIRQEITRAETESMVPVVQDVKSGRVCFNCRKQHFTFWYPANCCGICRKRYCSRCVTMDVEIPSHLIDVSGENGTSLSSNSLSLPRNRSLSFGDLAKTYITPFRVKRQSLFKMKHQMRTAGPVYTLCKECKRFLDAIATEKRNTQWQVRLEMNL